MIALGVDLAAEAAGTALATLDWSDGRASLVRLQLGVIDAVIVEAAKTGGKLGIDCAFGWPDEFIASAQAHPAGEQPALPVDGGKAWRSKLAYRGTDRIMRERAGHWPLGVSADRLSITAMRCAGLLRRLDEAGVDTDRAGYGDVAEVYPGAAAALGSRHPRVQDRCRRSRAIARAAPRIRWLDLGEYEPLVIRSADAFDAVIAALTTQATAIGRYAAPTPGEQLERARREGWIVLPDSPLDELAQD